jgi:hypothetical protein
MELYNILIFGTIIILFILLTVCTFWGLHLLRRIVNSLGMVNDLKTAMESVARANTEASTTSSDALKKTIGELDRILQESNHQMQTRYEAALRQLSQTSDRFQSTITDHLQQLEEHEKKHASIVDTAMLTVQKENALVLARATDAMRSHIKDLQEVSGKATQQIVESIERFQKILEQQNKDAKIIAEKQLAVVEATGTHMGNTVESAAREMEQVFREQEQKVQQNAASLRNEIVKVSDALIQLKNSLEEAVKF